MLFYLLLRIIPGSYHHVKDFFILLISRLRSNLKGGIKNGGRSTVLKFVLRISILLLLITTSKIYATDSLKWDYSKYKDYDYKSFFDSRYARQKIKFDDIDYPLLHAAIFYETNRQRVLSALSPFIHSLSLEKAAHEHSIDMVAYNFFSHTSVIKGKETMSKRLAKVGIKNAYTAENIANFSAIEYQLGKSVFAPSQNGGYFSYTYRGEPIGNRTYMSAAKAVLKQWMGSPMHRKNILNKKFKYLGVGAAYFEEENFYNMPYFKVTQNFASVRGS